ncbi:forkhead box protein R1 [Gouania willdenowi]|uniref:forkhead box protein R1 n=1 Tax=Gouania willdenowi TaxID=441366 RepID=UPI001054D2D7|nr:forkhead box protein N5-like [Gouania willdenowi]
MTLQLRTKPWLSSRHCCVALTDWDMDQELKLGTTSDQLHHDSFVRPSPWLWVSPGISCPIQYSSSSNSSSNKMEDDRKRAANYRKTGRTDRGCDSLRLSTWPRPPVNYCILIGLALRSSSTGSLKVQQIYSFTREHFPFFVTAPDGWKNTIRHNLCFNSSFRKTCTTLGRDGKRKSCLWHLTTEGERRLRDDVVALSADTVRLLHRSMARPVSEESKVCVYAFSGPAHLSSLPSMPMEGSGGAPTGCSPRPLETGYPLRPALNTPAQIHHPPPPGFPD